MGFICKLSKSRALEKQGLVRTVFIAILFFTAAGLKTAAIDLSHAIIVAPANASKPERKAAAMLRDEVEKRSQIKWELSSSWPTNEMQVIAVGQESALKSLTGSDEFSEETSHPADGFRIRIKTGKKAAVFVTGNDPRGVLFGVGYLLRQLHMRKGAVSLADDLNVTTAPKYPLRGHQLG